MSETGAEPPIEHPDIVIADTGPLISLARANALGLLHEIAAEVVIVDVVRLEATRHLDKPQAVEIQKWIEDGLKPGSNNPIRVERTTVGELLNTALKADPKIKSRDAGENAIADWLTEKVNSTFNRTIVIYENGKVGRLIADRNIDADIDIITTRAFLALAERRRLIPSAEQIWRKMESEAPTTNPKITGSFNRRPPASTIDTPTELNLLEIGSLYDGSSQEARNFARAALLNELRESGTRQTTLALMSLVPVKDRYLVERAAILGLRMRKDELTDDLTQLAGRIVNEARPLPATESLHAGLTRNGASQEYLAGLEREMKQRDIER